MFCQYCGSKLEETVRFCPNCGHPVETSDAATPGCSDLNQSYAGQGTTEGSYQNQSYAGQGGQAGIQQSNPKQVKLILLMMRPEVKFHGMQGIISLPFYRGRFH